MIEISSLLFGSLILLKTAIQIAQ